MCGGHVVWLAVWRRGWGEVNHVFVYIWKGEAGVGGHTVWLAVEIRAWGGVMLSIWPRGPSRGALEADHF